MSYPPSPETENTEQHIQNLSFDKEFNVLVAEMVAFDGSNLVRVKVDSTGKLILS